MPTYAPRSATAISCADTNSTNSCASSRKIGAHLAAKLAPKDAPAADFDQLAHNFRQFLKLTEAHLQALLARVERTRVMNVLRER